MHCVALAYYRADISSAPLGDGHGFFSLPFTQGLVGHKVCNSAKRPAKPGLSSLHKCFREPTAIPTRDSLAFYDGRTNTHLESPPGKLSMFKKGFGHILVSNMYILLRFKSCHEAELPHLGAETFAHHLQVHSPVTQFELLWEVLALHVTKQRTN